MKWSPSADATVILRPLPLVRVGEDAQRRAHLEGSPSDRSRHKVIPTRGSACMVPFGAQGIAKMAATNLSFDPSAPGPARPRCKVSLQLAEHGRATVSRRLRFVARVLAIPWGPRENHKPPRPPNPLRLKGGQPQDKSGCWAVPGHVWGVGWVAWVGKGRHFPQPSNEPGPKMQQNFTLNPAQPTNT